MTGAYHLPPRPPVRRSFWGTGSGITIVILGSVFVFLGIGCMCLGVVGAVTSPASTPTKRPVVTEAPRQSAMPTMSVTPSPATAGSPAVVATPEVIATPADEPTDEYDGGTITAGAYCSTSRLGQTARSANGTLYTCKGPKPYRWRR